MQRERELHVQTEEGKSTDLAKPTEPTLRLAEVTRSGYRAASGPVTGSSIAAWSRSWGSSVSSVPPTSGNCYRKAMTGPSHSPRPTSPAGSIVRSG